MVARTLAALLVLLVAGCADASDARLSLPPGEPFVLSTSVSPRTTAFGDPITATLRILVDRGRVDPDSIEVRHGFSPFRDRTTVERIDSGGLTALVYTSELSCLTLFCVPTDGAATATFSARVTSGSGGVQEARWPEVTVVSRMSRTQELVPENSGEVDQWPPRWRAGVSLPEPSYRVSPTALAWALAALGLLLAGASALAGWLAFRRGRLVRALDVPPLERALRLLRDSRSDEERRAALEALALALEPDLAEPARALAWSEGRPSESAAEELATRAEEGR